MKKELQNSIEIFLSELNTEIDVLNYVDLDNIDFNYAFDSIKDMIEDNGGFDIEVIYYSNAVEYLSENDPSFTESLNLASDMGFSLESLNSEVLASLLKSENARLDFYALEDEINSFFNKL